MTLVELHRDIDVAAAHGDSKTVHFSSWNFHMRCALSLATVVLAGFLLVLSRRGRAVRAFAAFVTCGVYWVLLVSGQAFSGYDGYLSGIAAAWLPNMAFVGAAMLLVSTRLRVSA